MRHETAKHAGTISSRCRLVVSDGTGSINELCPVEEQVVKDADIVLGWACNAPEPIFMLNLLLFDQ